MSKLNKIASDLNKLQTQIGALGNTTDRLRKLARIAKDIEKAVKQVATDTKKLDAKAKKTAVTKPSKQVKVAKVAKPSKPTVTKPAKQVKVAKVAKPAKPPKAAKPQVKAAKKP